MTIGLFMIINRDVLPHGPLVHPKILQASHTETPRAAMQINAEVLVCVAEVWVTIFDFERSGSVARTPPLHMIFEQVAWWPLGYLGCVTGEISNICIYNCNM